MRINIYLIRHGEAISNTDPLFKGENTLTQLGQEQALNLSKNLEKIRIKKIYSSPSLRAQQTADEVCKMKKLDKKILDFIDERKVSYTNDKKYENRENFIDFLERIKRVKILFENEKERHIAVFCHAIFIKGLLAYIMMEDKLTEELFDSISHKIAIDHAKISRIIYNSEKDKWHISLLNSEQG